MQDGLLLVNKPKGMTSHDVICHLRRALKNKRLGHTGTLDPMATGVLPVLVGKATRLSNYLVAGDKSYRTTLLLGITTDTMDAEGQVTGERAVEVTPEQIKEIVSSFVGAQKQLPPMYSAKKVGGKKLYELARKGVEIEREPCDITIFSIDIVEMDLPRVILDVHCSSGTYIRVLGSDIGEKAGCGAHLITLERTGVGPFKLDKTTTLAELEAHDPQFGYDRLLSMKEALYNLPQKDLTAVEYGRIIHGNPVVAPAIQENQAVALLHHDEVIAIGLGQTLADGTRVVQPKSVLV